MSTTSSSAADTEAELEKIEIRHTSPENILYIWEAIVKESKNSPEKSVNITKLIKCLVNHIKYETSEAEEIITTAIKDKLIIPINSENGVNNKKKRPALIIKLPNKQDVNINKNSYDWYCYECHKPNPDGLQRCIQCLRSFHTSCWRIDLDKSNYSSVEAPNRKKLNIFKKTASNKNVVNTSGSGPINNQINCSNENSIDTFSEQQQNAIEIDCDEQSIENYDNLDETNKPITILSDVQENNESDYQNISLVSVNNCDLKNVTKDDIKSEIDCFYVCDVRPPSRKKCGNLSQSFKSETNNRNENDDETEKKLCSFCRLMNKSELSNPPNKSKEDINYLLRFAYARIKLWISADTFSTLRESNILTIYKSHINLFSSLCFKYPKTLKVIGEKLTNNEYSSLTEFQCDFMDVQHCIGILYGLGSEEYFRTDYLFSECLHELSEIRLCSDCYRYSNEKASEDWFCKPCVPRHELVFAKQAGYRYWPAKVMRVEGNRYDVRFFGLKHTRAIVDAKNIESIDTEIDEIKTYKLTGFKKAMDELHKHQKKLIPLPASEVTLTTFVNDFQVINNVNDIPNLQSCNKSRKKQHQEQQQQQNQQLQYTQLVNQQLVNITCLPNIRGSSKRKRKSSHSQNSPIDLIYESENRNTTPVLENTSLATANKKLKILLTSSEKTTRNRNIRKSMNTPLPDISSSNSPSFTFTRKSRSESLYEMNNRTMDDETLVSSTQETDLNKEQRTGKSINDTVEIFHKELISIKNLSVKKRIALEKFFKTELNHLQEQINIINKQHKIEISATKRQIWCVQCEKIARFSCCGDANYCSSNCQIQHWPIHKRKCTSSDNDERSVKKFKNVKRLC